MKYWRALLWLLPLATVIPLSVFVYELATLDFSANFIGVNLLELIAVLGLPSLAILIASVIGARVALKGRPTTALVIAAGVYAWQLYRLAWSAEFWDAHYRPSYLLVHATPGIVAGLLALSGVLVLRRSNRLVVVIVVVLMVAPLLTNGGAAAFYAVNAARDCPPGPTVDLTFSGLENAHFTSSCGIPVGVATLAECKTYDVTVGLRDWNEWSLSFHPYGRTVTSAEFPYWAPNLIVGGSASYGGPLGWEGSYTFEPGHKCAGTVDAQLFATSNGVHGGYVHVSGRFDAPE